MHSSVGMQLISVKAMLNFFFLQEAEDVWQITVHLALKQTLHFPTPHWVELIYKGSLLNSYSIVEKKIDRSSFT